MMRPLRQRSWYKHLDLRWQTDILHLLPPSTVAEIKRSAASVLVMEADRAFSGPHPLIRSYNMHASAVRLPMARCSVTQCTAARTACMLWRACAQQRDSTQSMETCACEARYMHAYAGWLRALTQQRFVAWGAGKQPVQGGIAGPQPAAEHRASDCRQHVQRPLLRRNSASVYGAHPSQARARPLAPSA
jgi:hypothetical protein